jgi:hypothetical protein
MVRKKGDREIERTAGFIKLRMVEVRISRDCGELVNG